MHLATKTLTRAFTLTNAWPMIWIAFATLSPAVQRGKESYQYEVWHFDIHH
jgi:hypothetical protein